MKRHLQTITTLLVFFLGTSGFSQVLFLEDFDQIPGPTAGGAGTYVFPSGWFLRNVDNRTPDAQVAYVNEAWERREDFGGNVVDSCAFSTSYYSPVGAANDWMWTPLIGPIPANALLSWNAKSYDPNYQDGYEVRIMSSGPPTGGTGVIGNQITNSTVLFSTANEQSTWVNRQVNLNAYIGQSVYIGFRNNSNDKFILVIDDVKVEVINNYDSQMLNTDTVTEYTLIPKTQVSPLPLEGNIRNSGVANLTNVQMKVDVWDASMTQIHTSTSTALPTLTPGATNTFNAGTWTPPSVPGIYTIKFYPVTNETEENPANDTITRIVEISDFTYARDNGVVVGALGIGAGNGGYMGQEFKINAPARLTAVQAYVTLGYTGRPYAAVVWDMAGGVPNTIVAYTDTLLYPDDSADFYTLPMDGGEFILNTGSYVVTMVEFPSDSLLQIGLTMDIFTVNRTWVDWPTNPISGWGNNEDFGPGFQRAYVIRPQIYPFCPPDILTGFSTTDAGCGLSDGSATATVSGTGPFEYSWSSGGTGITETGLAVGNYIVTVTDVYSTCTETDTVTIINPSAPVIDSVTTTDPLCFGNTGSATAFVSGGTPGYSYLWSDGSTTATVVLSAGNYTLTVTDSANCQSTSIFTITNPAVLGSSASGTDESCVGCNNGTATVTPTGGTGGYTYSWAPSGGTSATATGLAPNTYTVTVTDANGCTSTSTVTINAFVPNGIEDEIGLYSTILFPNPSIGIFTLSGTIDYEGEVKIEILNVLGSAIYNKTMNVQNEINTTIDAQISAGNYMVKITAGKYSTTKPLIIK